MAKAIGVGIIGIQPDRSWGAIAHVPALRLLPDQYRIEAVSTTRIESARAAAEHYDIPRHFASVEDLCACDAVDLVAVTVKVPAHLALVRTALAAGKHVYCEWPLGNGLDEAIEMADAARAAGVVATCGMQARFAPELAYARDLIADGYVGEVLSATLIGNGGVWGPVVPPADAYNADVTNGATMLTIPLGHTLDGVAQILGDLVQVSARLGNRRTEQLVLGENRTVPLTAPDQIMLHGVLKGGALLSVHYRGGMPAGTGFLLEINGTAGDLQISGPVGHAQLADLQISGARSGEALAPLSVPAKYSGDADLPAVIGNVYRSYRQLANDIATGSRLAPSFDAAVARHRMIAAIEASAAAGGRSIDITDG
ncbi:Gfo/Idh/MocA family oxidoreductase [Sphingomonas aliaeris]|uniref:Gfo/Idh/MocA family oxidoreductase n=1 Tax=Sphingomonas aliaeris TaxID=2759526 RepID=A0A974NVD6_9SPHN|nr:Gfo/Idh/MocA family oxidoreductase [Sphingomonas aliaeris]QQV77658.1 Gfo/Idh/MocA family oxidoreductase [Sphingomonas aliaeris]